MTAIAYTGITAKASCLNAADKALAKGQVSLHFKFIRLAALCDK